MAAKRAKVNEENATAALGSGGILDRIGGTPATVEVRDLPLEQIEPNPFQPRTQFDPTSLEELASAIRSQGFYGHLVVRPHGRGYELAYGERRLRAAKLADLKTIPAQVRELSNNQMMEIALTENVLRENLHPIEEARGYLRLQETMGYSVRKIAERIGKSKSYVASLLSLLRFEDVAEAVRTADIPVRTAEELSKIEDATQRAHYLRQVVARKLNREQLIAALTQKDTPISVRTADKIVPVAAAFNRAYRTLERQHADQVQTAEKAEAIRLLQHIIDRANRLLEELEKD
jgi:ParB family transcriptional regulator, chromosome partitioning protein